jgi:hypothetical protein
MSNPASHVNQALAIIGDALIDWIKKEEVEALQQDRSKAAVVAMGMAFFTQVERNIEPDKRESFIKDVYDLTFMDQNDDPKRTDTEVGENHGGAGAGS